MATTPQPDQEFCPDCGDFVDALNEQTGFCFSCTPSAQSLIVPTRLEKWLTKNAELIECTMRDYTITAKQAILYVSTEHRARCVICNRIIRHGTYGRHFICNTTPECKKARRRYKYLIYDKGFTKEEALQQIIPTGVT